MKYLPGKFYKILMSDSPERRTFPRFPRSFPRHKSVQSQFLTRYACAAFNWDLTVMTRNLENCWILCILTFSKTKIYKLLCHFKKKHTTYRTGVEEIDHRSIGSKFFYTILVRALPRVSKEDFRARPKLCSATLRQLHFVTYLSANLKYKLLCPTRSAFCWLVLWNLSYKEQFIRRKGRM